MRKKTQWNGTYRGIPFEIQNFGILTDNDAWAFYLYVHLDMLPENIKPKFWLSPQPSLFAGRVHYDYMSEPFLADLDWHCGITYYEKSGGFDGLPQYVKIGCDYQHYWDEGQFYSVEFVEHEAKRCIDSLIQLIPEIKVRCSYCGAFEKSPDDEAYRCVKCLKTETEKEQ